MHQLKSMPDYFKQKNLHHLELDMVHGYTNKYCYQGCPSGKKCYGGYCINKNGGGPMPRHYDESATSGQSD